MIKIFKSNKANKRKNLLLVTTNTQNNQQIFFADVGLIRLYKVLKVIKSSWFAKGEFKKDLFSFDATKGEALILNFENSGDFFSAIRESKLVPQIIGGSQNLLCIYDIWNYFPQLKNLKDCIDTNFKFGYFGKRLDSKLVKKIIEEYSIKLNSSSDLSSGNFWNDYLLISTMIAKELNIEIIICNEIGNGLDYATRAEILSDFFVITNWNKKFLFEITKCPKIINLKNTIKD